MIGCCTIIFRVKYDADPAALFAGAGSETLKSLIKEDVVYVKQGRQV